ncbi:MAG: ATP-binding protein [Elusimicrobia bacterium]|nr:ATP-binding protein [Elusimicrobiota bacterium]
MMMRKLGFKLTLVACVTALVTIGIFSFFNTRSDSRNLLAEVERHASQLSDAVKSATEYDMLLNQRERIRQSIQRMGNQPSIQRIRVMNKAGEIIYSSDRGEIGRMVDKKAESCYICHSDGEPLKRLEMKERTRIFRARPDASRTLGIISPIYNMPSCWTAACHVHSKSQAVLGVLDVTMPLTEVDKDIRQSQLEILVFAGGAVLALSLIIGLFVKRWVDAPVKELLAATRRVADGDLRYMIKVTRDDELGMLAEAFNNMTHRLSEARLQLFQSDKLASLGRLAAGVAHEINNPLTGVLTYSSYLLKRAGGQPEMQKDLQVIVRETMRSREIVKSLLDFARQSVPNRTKADIHRVIDLAAAVVENQLAINKVRLVKEYAPDIPPVTIDSNQIQQVFINLFVNAADAIGQAGGVITVTSSKLSLSPVGTTQIKKALCPKRHDLLDREYRIDGMPSIRIKVRSGAEEGFLHLDPVYGLDRAGSGLPFEAGSGAAFMCPECSSSLIAPKTTCPKCGSAVYAFEVPFKGMVEGCTRPGCKWRRWEAVDAAGTMEFVEVKVRDTGCGIPGKDLARIFEPFYSTKDQKGTGLGLAVIWGILDNHNGTIGVESEEGRGTVFTVRIPVKP